MLDKHIPYKSIIMKLEADKQPHAAEPLLPVGFHFKHFEAEHVIDWARIETSVLEFNDQALAAAYFTKVYLPYLPELRQRCHFILNEAGLPIATATAWWHESETIRKPSLHWVAVCPDYQGKGLGKAMVQKALSYYLAQGNTQDVYLHTQTWSHKAVMLYAKLGFSMQKTTRFANLSNEYSEAIDVLGNVLSQSDLAQLVKNAQ